MWCVNSILLKTPQQTVTEQDKNLVNRNNVTLYDGDCDGANLTLGVFDLLLRKKGSKISGRPRKS